MWLMGTLASKWYPVILIVGAIAVVLYALGHKSTKTEIFIEAAPELVWQVLTDISRYEEWNTVLLPLGDEVLQQGKRIKYVFIQADKKLPFIISLMVRQSVNDALLYQSAGIPGIFTLKQAYFLYPTEGGTRLVMQEDYRGVAVNFWDPEHVQTAYQKMHQLLAGRAVQLKKEAR